MSVLRSIFHALLITEIEFMVPVDTEVCPSKLVETDLFKFSRIFWTRCTEAIASMKYLKTDEIGLQLVTPNLDKKLVLSQ